MLALVTAALGYETDQLTFRSEPLQDALPAANLRINEILAAAVDRSNRDTRCKASVDATRRNLGRHIYRLSSRAEFVEGRKGLEGFGYGVYSAWLETADIDRRSFLDRSDIFGTLAPRESFILASAGVASTVNLGGVLLGTDKLDHFLGEGYAYAEVSDWGAEPMRAIKWGTTTELTYYGLLTSSTFSWADLRANWDGYRFYVGLLGEESAFRRAPDGCVVQVRPFDWTEYLDTEYDEVLNPPVFAKTVTARVAERLGAGREQYCRGWEVWGQGLPERVRETMARASPYASRNAPARVDPFQLEALCGASAPVAVEAPPTR